MGNGHVNRVAGVGVPYEMTPFRRSAIPIVTRSVSKAFRVTHFLAHGLLLAATLKPIFRKSSTRRFYLKVSLCNWHALESSHFA